MRHSAFILLLLSFFVVESASAQTKSDETKAKLILDDASKVNKAYTTIKANFVYVLENKEDKLNEKQEGSLMLKGNKFKLNIGKQEIIGDGKTVWVYMKEANEVQVKTQEDFNSETEMNPTKIFTIYETGFKFAFLKEATENAKTVEIVDIFPLEPKKKPYSRIRLSFDKASKQLVNSKSFGKDGNTYTLSITKFTPNTVIEDSQFTFQKANYPGVEVVDMR